MSTAELSAKSVLCDAAQAASPFLPLPILSGRTVRLLGPRPAEASTAVDPLVRLDESIGAIQAFIGAICDPAGELILPVEILLVDPLAVVPEDPDRIGVPHAALIRNLNALPRLYESVTPGLGDDIGRALFASAERVGPLLYCRKRHALFQARSSRSLRPFSAIIQSGALPPAADSASAEDEHDVAEAAGLLPISLLCWDGPPGDGAEPKFYGGLGGPCRLGIAESFEKLVLEQGQVARTLASTDGPDTASHTCSRCSERDRCFPTGPGYAFALDRLSVISATECGIFPLPLGELRLDEAARVLGRLAPTALPDITTDKPANSFEEWRRLRMKRIEAAGPAFLLAGEANGRDLVEIARLKLALIAGALEQIDTAWKKSQLPHLCWNDETIRVAHRRTPAPASYWGFQPIVRKLGLQPGSAIRGANGQPLAYPPVYAKSSLLPLEAAETVRYFGVPAKAGVFVKTSTPDTGATARVTILLEDSIIPRRLLCTPDVLRIAGDGWTATLSPLADHDPNDGEGLPFSGTAAGNVSVLKPGQQFPDCSYTWYPRYGQAVDLHALGMLLFESLLSNDEQSRDKLRSTLATERDALTTACLAVDTAQRAHEARVWIATRCENDAPASNWSRRNLLFRRDERASARLDACPPLLWQALVTLGFRLMSFIPGFSYCADRAADAPATRDGRPLPLVEMLGLLALMDDVIFARSAAVDRARELARASARK